MPQAELCDVRCCYEIVGRGQPLLMIAGLGASYDNWGVAAVQWAQSFTLILPDNRGIGRSLAKRQPQSLADLACDYVELLDYLQVDRCHVLGASLGGMIAQRLAIDHPSRVERLVLVSCAHRFGPYLRQMAWLLEQTLRRFPPEVFEGAMQLLGSSPKYFDEHADDLQRAVEAVDSSGESRSAIARQLWCVGCSEVMAADEDYRIEAPTLVIAGQNDVLIPAIYGRRMAEQIAGSEFFLVEECGHNVLREKPAVAIPRIVEFLGRSRSGHDQADRSDIHQAMLAGEGRRS